MAHPQFAAFVFREQTHGLVRILLDQQRNAIAASRTLLDMTLQELRQDVAHMSQADLAEALTVTQGYISRVERQGDMLLSKLYAYVRALGGEVEIRAKLPGHQEVRITQFQGLDSLGEELGR